LNCPAHHRIEAQRRIVENHQFGAMGERQQEAEANVLPFGEVAYFLFERQFELANVLVRQVVIPARIKGRDKANELVDPHPAIHRLVFRQVAHIAAHSQGVDGRIVIQHPQLSRVAREEPQHHPNRGGLARPVAPQKGKRLAARHAQRRSVQHRVLAKRFADIFHGDRQFVHDVGSGAGRGEEAAT
jgi:hypothetical protein